MRHSEFAQILQAAVHNSRASGRLAVNLGWNMNL